MNKNSDSMSKTGHEIPDDEVTIKCRKLTIRPKSKSQQEYLSAILNNDLTFGIGSAGTGKTFITLYNALREVLDERSPYDKIYIVRSLVATREIGFLPGDHEDKSDIYQIPYKNMVKYLSLIHI